MNFHWKKNRWLVILKFALWQDHRAPISQKCLGFTQQVTYGYEWESLEKSKYMWDWCIPLTVHGTCTLVSRGQTLFRTEGKGLGLGHRATCRTAPWSAYQSQHSIQSHDTWSMWLTGKFKISVWVEREPEAWEVRTEREVSWDISWNTAESKSRVQKGRLHDCHVTSWLDLHD